jgi:hypothetical protein
MIASWTGDAKDGTARMDFVVSGCGHHADRGRGNQQLQSLGFAFVSSHHSHRYRLLHDGGAVETVCSFSISEFYLIYYQCAFLVNF